MPSFLNMPTVFVETSLLFIVKFFFIFISKRSCGKGKYQGMENTEIWIKVDDSYRKSKELSRWKTHMENFEIFRHSLRSFSIRMMSSLLCVHIHSPSSDWQRSQWVLKHLIIFRVPFYVFSPKISSLFQWVIHFYSYYCIFIAYFHMQRTIKCHCSTECDCWTWSLGFEH